MTYSPAVHMSYITFHAEIIFIYHFTWKKTYVRVSMHASYYYYNYCYICTRIKAVVYGCRHRLQLYIVVGIEISSRTKC